MPHIELPEELFIAAQQRAMQSGFQGVEEYIEFLLSEELAAEQPSAASLEHFFTPERLAEIDEAIAEADRGELLSMEQLDDHLAKQRQAWLAQKSA